MLAQTRLEAPRNPPLSQQDLLATALQPIVSFVVLGSILIRLPTLSVFENPLSCSRCCRWPFDSIFFYRSPYLDRLSFARRGL